MITQQTHQWINGHFPEVFDTILFGNHWARDSPDPDVITTSKRTKPEMCAAVDAIALIDDSMNYAHQCSEALGKDGFKVAVFGEYGWNRGEVPMHAVRTKDWSEVGQFLHELNEEIKSKDRRRRELGKRVWGLACTMWIAFTVTGMLRKV